jgi:hypothetical protein
MLIQNRLNEFLREINEEGLGIEDVYIRLHKISSLGGPKGVIADISVKLEDI